MKLGHIGLVGLLLVVTSEGLKLPKSFKLETRHHDVSSVVPGVSGTTRFIGPNSPLHSCLNAISTGSPEMLTPLCKAWALEFIRNRNSIEDTKVDLANNEEPQQNRSLQDLISLAKAFKRLQDFENVKVPSRPDGAHFYSPATNKWERIRF